MSYRFNVVDIIVGVGMSAIMFGALLFFVVTTGTFETMSPELISAGQLAQDPTGMSWLQPPLGQAIVDRMLLERRINRSYAEAVSAWNRATMASHDVQPLSSNPFGVVMQTAAIAPAEHMARVQAVIGRSIVNFTRRGIRSGVLSAGYEGSEYNTGMIRKAEAMGQRLDDAFASTWQPTLGRTIVETAQLNSRRTATIQEQLGSAIVHVSQSQIMAAEARDANEEQLASLVVASVRGNALSDRLQLLAALEFPQQTAPVSVAETASLPTIPLGFLIAAVAGLGTIFFAGLFFSARGREMKAQADLNRETSRWVYRAAA